MKKFWQIAGTERYADNKEELKGPRSALNKEAGVNEAENKDPKTWPYKLTKGPEHPSRMPFFRDVKLNSLFTYVGSTYKKVDGGNARSYADGVLGFVNKPFSDDVQVHLV